MTQDPNKTLLENYVKAIIAETLLKEEYDVYGNTPKVKTGLRHYKIVPPKRKQQPIKRVVQQTPSNLEDHQKDFLINALKRLPKNITAQKILGGMPLTKKEVYVLSKFLVQSGVVPVKHFKELARILAGLAFELQTK